MPTVTLTAMCNIADRTNTTIASHGESGVTIYSENLCDALEAIEQLAYASGSPLADCADMVRHTEVRYDLHEVFLPNLVRTLP